jgi:predicted nucleic acid-binding protein
VDQVDDAQEHDAHEHWRSTHAGLIAAIAPRRYVGVLHNDREFDASAAHTDLWEVRA